MADTSQEIPPEGTEPQRASRLEDIEQDLDTVDAALVALDSGDLEGAESLAAELEGPHAGTQDRDHRDAGASAAS